MQERLLGISKAAKILDVSIGTLRNWDKWGKLVPVRTPTNHRKYRLSDLKAFMNLPADPIKEEIDF